MSQAALQWRACWDSGPAPDYAPIPPPSHPTADLDSVIERALEEDSAGIGDLSTLSTIPEDAEASATFLAKADGVLAGLYVATRVFALVDARLSVDWSGRDGQRVARGTRFGSVRGPTRSLLVAERVALNFLQRMSGIASATAEMVAALQGTSTRVLCTRKTAPGLRLVDKWAVVIGGGVNHRIGLFDMVMIKDNHHDAAGGIQPAIQQCKAYLAARGLAVPVEVEARDLGEVRQVLAALEADPACGVTRVMLDNMAPRDPAAPGGVDISQLREAVALVGGRLETEASGNVTLASAAAIAASGVTYLSCGALTHSVTAMDISLKIQRP